MTQLHDRGEHAIKPVCQQNARSPCPQSVPPIGDPLAKCRRTVSKMRWALGNADVDVRLEARSWASLHHGRRVLGFNTAEYVKLALGLQRSQNARGLCRNSSA